MIPATVTAIHGEGPQPSATSPAGVRLLVICCMAGRPVRWRRADSAQVGPRYVLTRTRDASTSQAPIDAGTPVTVLSVRGEHEVRPDPY
jgi:hypothetical protein